MGHATLVRFMIIHYQAVLKTTLNHTARAVVLQLLAKAECELLAVEQAHDQHAEWRGEVAPNVQSTRDGLERSHVMGRFRGLRRWVLGPISASLPTNSS